MEFNQRQLNLFRNVFSLTEQSSSSGTSSLVTFDQNNVFNKFFVLDINPDELEIPLFMRGATEYEVDRILISEDYNIDRMVVPLYSDTLPLNKRTSDSIVKAFFSKINFTQRLIKVTTPKGDIYYGGRGIILDRNFNIIILCSIACRREVYEDRNFMRYYKPIVYVNPSVFTNDSDLINRYIIKKIIPFYIMYPIRDIFTYTHNFRSFSTPNVKAEILIKDVSHHIETPSVPDINTGSNSNINKFLKDNVDELLELI